MRKKRQNGFSFLELMVTVGILSVGLVMVYQSFFVCLNYLTHITYRLHAHILMDNKLNDIQRYFHAKGVVPWEDTEGREEIRIYNKLARFFYTVDFKDIPYLADTFEVNLALWWREGNREIHLSRSTYILK